MLFFLRYRVGITFRIRKTPLPPPNPTQRNDPGKSSLPTPEFTAVPSNPP